MKLSLSPDIHKKIFLFGVFLLVASLPFSKITISISEIILFGNWILEGGFKNKWQTIKSDKVLWIVLLMFIIHIAGLFFTTNFDYAIKDLRIKFPLLVLPLIFATSEKINTKTLRYVLLTFVGILFIYTLISLYFFLFKNFVDIREISPFVSHIRLSLMIVFSILLLIYFVVKNIFENRKINILFIFGSVWFFGYLLLAESLTGIVILICFSLGYLIYYIFRKGFTIFTTSFLIIFFLIIGFSIYMGNNVCKEYFIVKPYDFSKLEPNTQYGNWYYHDTTSLEHENGNLVNIYISDAEMKDVWEKRSMKPYTSENNYFTYIRYTLIRYLTSKGERKDANAVYAMSDKEIKAVENGCANILYTSKSNIIGRFHQILWEIEKFNKYYDPNGQSLSQRFEYWKTSFYIFKKNWITGVGTGDLNEEFAIAYKELNSPLTENYRLRSHNQFLAIAMSFGIIGFICFLISMFLPAFKLKKYNYFYYTAFIIIAALSMLSEDTLETQVGVTFFAFFQSFLIFSTKNE